MASATSPPRRLAGRIARVAGATLVANPGCYPTPVALGAAPLVEAGLIDPAAIVVDGKTGLSGAGRGPKDATTFAATEDSVRPYRFPGHQHKQEMERSIALGTGQVPSVGFVPHLVPTVRGVLTTCYARLRAEASTEALTEGLVKLQEKISQERWLVRKDAPAAGAA